MPSFLLQCIRDGAVGGTDKRRSGLKQKEGKVRIDSSVIGMESTRRYSSVTSKSVRASSMRYVGIPYKPEHLFGNLLGFGENED